MRRHVRALRMFQHLAGQKTWTLWNKSKVVDKVYADERFTEGPQPQQGERFTKERQPEQEERFTKEPQPQQEERFTSKPQPFTTWFGQLLRQPSVQNARGGVSLGGGATQWR